MAASPGRNSLDTPAIRWTGNALPGDSRRHPSKFRGAAARPVWEAVARGGSERGFIE
jgi:hypothetical protein